MRRLTPERQTLRRSAIRLRRELGWSQQAIGAHLRVPRSTIEDWLKTVNHRYSIPVRSGQVDGNGRYGNDDNGPLALNTVHIMDVLEGLPLLALDEVELEVGP